MRTNVILAAALLALGTPALAQGKPVTPAEKKKAAKAFREYVRESDEKARDKVWKGVRKLAERLSIAEVEELVAEAVPGEEWKGGFTDGIEFESGGETWTYSAILPRKKPKGLIPLVLDVGHGSWKDNDAKGRKEGMETWLNVAKCKDDVVYVRTRVIDQTSLDGRYTTWAGAPRKSASEPNSDTFAAILMDAVRDACLRYPIDPDRVYVQGISQTGYWTWWLGQYAPDRWGAIVPVGAVTFHVRKLLPNLVNVPVFVLHGTKDPTCPFAQADGAVKDLKALGGTVDFRPTEGGGHMNGVFVRFGEIWPEVMKQERNPYPVSFERLLLSDTRRGRGPSRDRGPASDPGLPDPPGTIPTART